MTNAIKDLRYESTVGDVSPSPPYPERSLSPHLQAQHLSSPATIRASSTLSISFTKECHGRFQALFPPQVASKTGLPPFESERALQALAADSAASIVVGPSGDLLYRFDRDFDTKILNKSFAIRTLQPLLEKAAGLAQWLGRFAFGSALLASLAVVAYAAVIAQRSDNDNRRRDGGGGFDLFFNPFRAIQIWLDPYYGYNPYYYAAMGYEPEPMTFPEVNSERSLRF